VITNPEDIPDMISELIDYPQSKLSEWEREFLTNISFKVDKGWSLSDKQQETLKKIYQRCIG
jgi:hypothetical protein